MLGVSHVVTTSVGMCDIDIRPVSSHLLLCYKSIFQGSEMAQIVTVHVAALDTDFEVHFIYRYSTIYVNK